MIRDSQLAVHLRDVQEEQMVLRVVYIKNILAAGLRRPVSRKFGAGFYHVGVAKAVLW